MQTTFLSQSYAVWYRMHTSHIHYSIRHTNRRLLMISSLEQEFALHMPNVDKPWFEGWYVRVHTKDISFAIIFGLQISRDKKSAFIQFLDTHTNKSRYVEYPWKAVAIQKHPFLLKIRGNRLTMTSITLRLPNLQANLLHSSLTPLHTSRYAPTIMGPFSYMPMECVHSIISLHHTVSGTLWLGKTCIAIHGSGYMEKDRGTSFPSSYVWFQSNNCEDPASCFFFSLAHIPFLTGSFQGCICVLMIHGKQLCFATYLGCRVIEDRKSQQIVLKQYPLDLRIRLSGEKGSTLASPKQGAMQGRIQETLQGEAFLTLLCRGNLIKSWHFTQGGLERAGIAC